jgi:hypothetical protein
MPFAPRPVARRAVRWVFSPKLEVHRHVTSACVISGVADPRRGGVRTEKSIHIDLGGSRLTGLTGCRSDPCYQLGPAVTCMFKKFWPFGLATRMHRRRTRRQFSHICDTRDKGLAYARACISCDRAQIGEMGSNSHLMVAAKLRRHNRAARADVMAPRTGRSFVDTHYVGSSTQDGVILYNTKLYSPSTGTFRFLLICPCDFPSDPQ